ncbi:MAG: hypothetical protein IPP07_10765 [Holophagales bacterium]|nr:hypothetical protein [Holophagales bacterium]
MNRNSLPAVALSVVVALLSASGCSRSEAGTSRPVPTRPATAAAAAAFSPAPDPTPAPPPAFDPVRAKLLTQTGRLLAGLPVGDGPLAAVESSAACQDHAKKIRGLWQQHDKARLEKVRLWAKEHLTEPGPAPRSLFYPFAGPDGLYPLAFFPSASRYVLVGLEPVGAVPDVASRPEAELASDLSEMEKYVRPILQISFFRTNEMKKDLAEEGVLPILMVFLAGTGHEILDVGYVTVGPGGSLENVPAGDESKRRGARILFRALGEEATRELLYFSQDLSDTGLKKRPELTAWLASLEKPATFLKAASYLMYKPTFSTVRGVILDHSSLVLQDDSGIPYRFFEKDRWQSRLFGSYRKPIRLFEERFQPDLVEAFAGPPPAEPLPFGIGYRHQEKDSNLMVARRVGAQAARS